MSVQRLAGQAWNGYKTNPMVQDIVETAVVTLGVAGAQALFSDMSPEEIAIAATVGVGAATAGRPLGDRVGRTIGRMADKRMPVLSKNVGAGLDDMRAQVKQMGIGEAAEIAGVKDHHFDGRGPLEGLGSLYGRLYGDNAAQALVGIVAPQLVPQEEPAPA